MFGMFGCFSPHGGKKNIHSLFGSIQFQENMTWANGSKSPRRLGCLWINFHCNMLDFENAAGCILNFNLLEHSIPKYKWTNFVGRQNAAIQMLQEKHINTLLWFCDSCCQTRKWYRPARVWHFCRKFISSTKKDNEKRHSVINLNFCSPWTYWVHHPGIERLMLAFSWWTPQFGESQFWWISNCGFSKAPSEFDT